MASLLALKKLVSSNLLPKSLRAARQAIPASRLFNTNAGGEFDNGESDDDDEKNYGVITNGAARQAIPASRLFNSKAGGEFDDDDDGYWSDGIGDPYPDIPDTLFHENLNMMDKIMDSPSASRGILPRRWEATKTEKAFYVRMDVPGWTKENVEIWGEHNYMFIQETLNNRVGDRFGIRIKIDLPSEFYKCERIKAQMKNGVLKIVVLEGPWKRERAEEFWVKVV